MRRTGDGGRVHDVAGHDAFTTLRACAESDNRLSRGHCGTHGDLEPSLSAPRRLQTEDRSELHALHRPRVRPVRRRFITASPMTSPRFRRIVRCRSSPARDTAARWHAHPGVGAIRAPCEADEIDEEDGHDLALLLDWSGNRERSPHAEQNRARSSSPLHMPDRPASGRRALLEALEQLVHGEQREDSVALPRAPSAIETFAIVRSSGPRRCSRSRTRRERPTGGEPSRPSPRRPD